jgi:Fe2+ or Zn2+ uptake regulation protein
MNGFYEKVKNKKINYSWSREAIYRIFSKNKDRCFCVIGIKKQLLMKYNRNVSLNTIYRHLDFFEANGLLVVVQNDDKKAFYCLKEDKPMAFIVCNKCHRIIKTNIDIELEKCSEIFKDIKYLTIHKTCEICSKKFTGGG